MKCQSTESKIKPVCHPYSKFRPLIFTKNNKSFLNNGVLVCHGCIDKIAGRGQGSIYISI